MRWVVHGLVAMCLAPHALAADLDDTFLRGSQYEPGTPVYFRWSGVYGGLQAGGSAAAGNFAGNEGPVIANAVGGTPIPPSVSNLISLSVNDTQFKPSYGAFFGYNAQWENVVLGVEVNYNHTSAMLSSSDARSATVLSGATTYAVNVSATSSAKLTDFGTIRGRAGWVFDNWMPYALFGIAVGRTESVQTAAVSYDTVPSTGLVGPVTASASQSNIRYGWALGAGLDWAVLPNVFVRGEYEYVDLGNLQGLALHVNSVRGGVGMKF
jgi:opacity protein-like surface antigen